MGKYCSECGKELKKDFKVCPYCGNNGEEKKEIEKNKPVPKKNRPPFFIVLSIIVGSIFWFIVIMAILFGETESEDNNTNNNGSTNTKYEENKKVSVDVIDFSKMSEEEIDSWCDENKVNCYINSDYSDTISKGSFVSQSVENGEKVYQGDRISIIFSLGKKPTTEMQNALKQAYSYSELMHMSKKGIYKQLTSEYGEGFSKEAAQYAIDNIEVDWNLNALENAKNYRDSLHMSKKNIYKQLISDYGEGFTKEQAQYAIDHLED